MLKNYRVTNSFENDERNKCVDIIQTPEGQFRFQEWRRDPEDLHGWFLLHDSLPTTFPIEAEVVESAIKTVAWFDG